jgi:antirestriction protein
MSEPRIYVASLSDYNAGILHGVWIDATQDDDEIYLLVHEMLAESPTALAEGSTAEEWAVHDFEGFYGLMVGEYTDLDAVSELAKALGEHGEAYAAYVNLVGAHYATPEGFEEAYEGEYGSPEDWAREWHDSVGTFHGVADTFEQYFDFEAFARDCEVGGDLNFVECSTGGVYAFRNA